MQVLLVGCFSTSLVFALKAVFLSFGMACSICRPSTIVGRTQVGSRPRERTNIWRRPPRGSCWPRACPRRAAAAAAASASCRCPAGCRAGGSWCGPRRRPRRKGRASWPPSPRPRSRRRSGPSGVPSDSDESDQANGWKKSWEFGVTLWDLGKQTPDIEQAHS
ncbi:hypothetical protein GQ55_5G418400 [Panicum hallii var. hallii]|uniref:Uncharacterized protein n=1 Tax=Panicum hallii var. hallii TaxID=1504633 RepID=A0A2T7DNX7_9POAL|nr:hypothetical protein GQ55_5G418400 [Panicum hallii var. hallii]